jgi:hypothetical protein
MLGAGGAALADQTIVESRLPVVFDLDDTLVLAHSPTMMDTKIRQLNQSRYGLQALVALNPKVCGVRPG